LFSHLGRGGIAPVAYDTAWVARVGQSESPDRPAFPGALDWLLAQQWGDGTWGGRLVHHHDRVISTLASMLALAQWREVAGDPEGFSERLLAAGSGLAPHVAALGKDPGASVDFWPLASALIAEARWRGLVLPIPGLEAVFKRSAERAGRLPAENLLHPRGQSGFSLEGWDGEREASQGSNFLADNGSLGGSPAATAAFLLRNPGCQPARAYLERVTRPHGGAAAPALDPAHLFETAWVLQNVVLTWPDEVRTGGRWTGAIESLRAGFAIGTDQNLGFAVPDLAGAALLFQALTWAGESPDPRALARFSEEAERSHLRPYEPRASVGADVHLLAALRCAPPFPGREAAMRKIIGALARRSSTDHFWVDSRHASPYYATSHAVLALGGELSMTGEAVGWIERTQRPDGSWGYFQSSTAEETAYCLQALVCHRRSGGQVSAEAIKRGGRWLAETRPAAPYDYQPLWMGKSLYTPTRVVHAAVLSALILSEA
jgi:halimadienyl-diphosphate synthase